MADFGWKNTILSSASGGDVSTTISRNPWGRAQTDGNNPLNLHRTDLWYVDFTTAAKGISTTLGSRTATLPSYYVKSINLPESRVKAEVFKRDSIPFNMPSWDDPLDPVSMMFLMESKNPNPVLQFLTDWLRIVRAGRGERYTDGYDPTLSSFTPDDSTSLGTEITLDSDFRIEISYPIKLWLLQGAISTATPISLPQNNLTSNYCKLVRVMGLEIMGWLGSIKVGDLTYEGTQVLTCEAKLYPEYIVQADSSS